MYRDQLTFAVAFAVIGLWAIRHSVPSGDFCRIFQLWNVGKGCDWLKRKLWIPAVFAVRIWRLVRGGNRDELTEGIALRNVRRRNLTGLRCAPLSLRCCSVSAGLLHCCEWWTAISSSGDPTDPRPLPVGLSNDAVTVPHLYWLASVAIAPFVNSLLFSHHRSGLLTTRECANVTWGIPSLLRKFGTVTIASYCWDSNCHHWDTCDHHLWMLLSHCDTFWTISVAKLHELVTVTIAAWWTWDR